MKSAAGKAGQSNPSVPVPGVGAPAVAQDLAVMADQARGYTQGIASGVEVARSNSAAAASRMAQEAAAAQAIRDAENATQAAQTAAAAERVRAAEEKAQEEAQAAQAGLVLNRMATRLAPDEADLFQGLITRTTNYDDAREAFDALRGRGLLADTFGTQTKEEDDAIHSTFLNYARLYHDALQGKAVDLRGV